jgi:hypothetical protein
MTITIEAYGTTHTITFKHNDPGLNAAMRAFVNLLIASGYSREGIARLFADGDPNGWDSAWPVPEDDQQVSPKE